MAASFALGFESLDEERSIEALPVDGAIPSWLSGSLLRNGPARFEVGGRPVGHWFDGLAMLRKFAFRDGSVSYANRFLRSREYESVVTEGALRAEQFGSGPIAGVFGRLGAGLVPSMTDNANVNVTRVGDRFVAITETPLGIEFDHDTLETRGPFTFAGDVGGQLVTAHPHHDRRRGETVNVVTAFGRRSEYRVVRRDTESARREVVASIEARRPAYLHSFALTARHVVLAVVPLVVNPLRILLPWSGGGSFIDTYDWEPDRGTRFLVVDRGTGAVVARPRADPFFCFHHVNAFTRDGALVVDLVAFPDADAISALSLDTLRSGAVPDLQGELRRYRLPLEGDPDVEAETLYADGMTLPRIADGYDTRPYRYAYGQGTPDPAGERQQRLVKVDVESGAATEWVEPGTYCSEPVFAPRPDVVAEDDGVVLSVLLEAGAARSSLLVLDAESFTERARAPLPHVLPFDFHGQFFPDVH